MAKVKNGKDKNKKTAKSEKDVLKKSKDGGKRPKSPMPAQHQPRPGIEAEMTPRPQFLAPD